MLRCTPSAGISADARRTSWSKLHEVAAKTSEQEEEPSPTLIYIYIHAVEYIYIYMQIRLYLYLVYLSVYYISIC